MNHDYMTAAELQTLREACGLSRDELGALAGVQARTVKFWEYGKIGVPADVADLVREVDRNIMSAVSQMVHSIRNKPVADVVFIRYRNEDMPRYRPDLKDFPSSVHSAILSRVRLLLPWSAGHLDRIPKIRIVFMMPDQYEAWRGARPDTEATRAEWAAGQVAVQARPHRADQPPL